MTYSLRERFWLWFAGIAGLFGLNAAFLFGVAHPEILREALENPVSLAFILEAFVLLGLLAYLLPKWGLVRLHWIWLVVLALIGSLAFALPVALLWRAPGRAPKGVG